MTGSAPIRATTPRRIPQPVAARARVRRLPSPVLERMALERVVLERVAEQGV